jgi:hypothetical protein
VLVNKAAKTGIFVGDNFMTYWLSDAGRLQRCIDIDRDFTQGFQAFLGIRSLSNSTEWTSD